MQGKITKTGIWSRSGAAGIHGVGDQTVESSSVVPVPIAVEATGLTKSFGQTRALCGVDLEVPEATVLGLLGPNGAGKTTTVRILTTLLRPDAGRCFIDGIDVVDNPRAVRTRIGVTGQYAAVDERLTGSENLQHVGRLFRLGGSEAKRRGVELLDQFDLTDAADRVVRGYSGGMRRRLDIAMSLISRPSVLFLDEPTTGLDPRSRMGMWDLIEGLVRDGTTTVLTTQYLDEAERLADQIVVIDHGGVIAGGTAAELKSQLGGARLTVTAMGTNVLDAIAEALPQLPMASGAPHRDVDTATVSIGVSSPDGAVSAAVRLLDGHDLEARDVVVSRPSLDDVFLDLTGGTALDPDATDDATTGGHDRGPS
jgi:ABC-2 type transport system ATP-binding protein